MSQEKEIQYRDQKAPRYEEWWIERVAYGRDWLERRVIMNRIHPQPEEVILDAGCGIGRFTLALAPKCKKVYATDFSPRSIEVLNERVRQEGIHNVESFAWDITQPFPFNEPVDKVVSCQVVQHIPTEPQRHQALQNMYDQLRDGGTLILSVLNWRPFFREGSPRDECWEGAYSLHRFAPAEVTAALQRCGFNNISVKGYANFGFYYRLNDRYPHLQHLIARGDMFFSRFNISRYRGDWLICTANK